MSHPNPSPNFTHLDESGAARMVDVSAKAVTARSATARGFVRCGEEIVSVLRQGNVPKGDLPAVVRLAAISGAKETARLLPLAHVIGIHGCSVEIEIQTAGVAIEATVKTNDRTGVEMEALTAVTIGALAVVDMVKGISREVSIENCRIVAKSGGRSGSWVREGEN